MAITYGPFQLIARFHGPQTSQRTDLMGLYVAVTTAPEGSTITMDKKAVVEYAPAPHRKALDIDLGKVAARLIYEKFIAVQWTLGHRRMWDACDAQQRVDFKRNNEVDCLAKLAITLPLPMYTPTLPSSISLGGTTAPTPAKKLNALLQPYPTQLGGHWAMWLRLRAQRGQAWLQWLWGNIRWHSFFAPWEKTKVQCGLCSDTHCGTPHTRLIHCAAWCLVFWRKCVRTWGPWAKLAQQWFLSASPANVTHISQLCVSQTFVDNIPPPLRKDVRYRVAWHQYHMMHATILFRQSLPMPQMAPGARK